jgi:hypothetical protein
MQLQDMPSIFLNLKPSQSLLETFEPNEQWKKLHPEGFVCGSDRNKFQ